MGERLPYELVKHFCYSGSVVVSFEGESGCSMLHCFHGLLIFLGVAVQIAVQYLRTMVLYEVTLALTNPVLRLHCRKLRVLVALLTVLSVCSFPIKLAIDGLS